MGDRMATVDAQIIKKMCERKWQQRGCLDALSPAGWYIGGSDENDYRLIACRRSQDPAINIADLRAEGAIHEPRMEDTLDGSSA
jgi:hypothetical protein